MKIWVRVRFRAGPEQRPTGRGRWSCCPRNNGGALCRPSLRTSGFLQMASSGASAGWWTSCLFASGQVQSTQQEPASVTPATQKHKISHIQSAYIYACNLWNERLLSWWIYRRVRPFVVAIPPVQQLLSGFFGQLPFLPLLQEFLLKATEISAVFTQQLTFELPVLGLGINIVLTRINVFVWWPVPLKITTSYSRRIHSSIQ